MPFSEQSSVLNALSSSAQEIASAKFLVGIMSPPDGIGAAMRLLQSCKAYSLAVVLYEVPAVHSSVSMKGSGDLSCTKPSFVRFLLDKYRKPVLCIEPGFLIAQMPSRIHALVDEGIDFAVYNWLADEHNEAYAPVDVQLREGWSIVVTSGRYYRYSHRVHYYDPEQLMCGAGVMFWKDSDNARELLNGWQRMIERNPKCADDHSLDFVYNYRGSALPTLKAAWLDKSYLRMGWWIYVNPVIDHPGIPATDVKTRESLEKREGVPRIVERRLKRTPDELIFPADCLVDTVERILVRPNLQNALEIAGPLPAPIWVTRE